MAGKRLIETEFPLIEVNTISEYEASFNKAMPKDIKEKLMKLLNLTSAKGFIFPKINNLHYYPARIPPSATRPVTLASLVNDSVSKNDLLNAIGLPELRDLVRKTGKLAPLFMVNPNKELVRKLVGTDPSNLIVVDPMAGGGSIPLEAKRLGFTVIAGDYNPVSYLLLRATIEFPAKYGEKLYNLVNEEAERFLEYIKNEVGKYYPEDSKNFIFFISAEHSDNCHASIPLIKETALNGKKNIYVSWKPNQQLKEIEFEISNKPSQPLAICPFCKMPISPETIRKHWIAKHKEIIEKLLSGDESAAEEVPRYYRLAAVQISTTKFRAPTNDDIRIMVEAARELARLAREDNVVDYLPIFEIPKDNKVFGPVRTAGLNFWHLLFTPRQLLFIYKAVKYIRERAEALKKAYGELGVAIALYLALGLAKMLNYNSILTQWHSSRAVIAALVGGQYALARKVELGYDFAEGNIPYMGLPWAFEAEEDGEDEEGVESTGGGLLPVLKLLCGALGGLWRDGRDAIYLWDARKLDEYLPEHSVDLINVDPPYYEQEDYGGILEFFWAILQTALRPVLDDLFPRDRVKIDWDPYDPRIPKELEIGGEPPRKVGETSEFGEDFSKFLRASSRVLKPDGLLVVWYSYGKLTGWEELFYRFYEAGYAVTKAWQVWTQMHQRRIALQSRAFFTSMVIIARPNASRRVVLKSEVVEDLDLRNEVYRRVRESLRYIISNYRLEHLQEALVVSLADGIAATTMFERPGTSPLSGYGYRSLLSAALKHAVDALLLELGGGSTVQNIDSVSRLYLVLLLASVNEKDTLKVSYDFANRISQVVRSSLSGVIVSSKGSKESIVLIPPGDIVKRGLAVSRALALIYEVSDLVSKGHIRTAEERAKNFSSEAPLALVIAQNAWEKLGINGINKETVINVLRKVMP